MPTTIDSRLVWIDMEMTGLDPDTDQPLEIASIITDTQLNILAEGPAIAMCQPPAVLERMDAWNRRTHTQSGLLERVRSSQVSVADAEQQSLQFLQQWVAADSAPICGNSIHQDRLFIRQYMPALHAFLHYRQLDVSTVKELATRWRPDLAAGLVKHNRHEALADIRESIAELRYYRDRFFVLAAPDRSPSE